MEGLLREIGHGLPAAPRLVLVGPTAAGLAALVQARHPDAQVTAAAAGDPRALAGPNLDLAVCADLDPASAAPQLDALRRALRPGGSLLLWLDHGWTPARVSAALEAAALEVVRVGPPSRSGLGLRARLGLPARTLVARALRHPGTAQH